MAQRCRELGLPFEPPEILSNSRMAVEAAEFAREGGKHGPFHRALLAAYFAEGRDIGDVDVLKGIAAEVGLEEDALEEALAAHRYADRRVATMQEAARLGIAGVPTFFFDSGARVVGAQPLDHFRRLLQAAEESRGHGASERADGPGGDG